MCISFLLLTLSPKIPKIELSSKSPNFSWYLISSSSFFIIELISSIFFLFFDSSDKFIIL